MSTINAYASPIPFWNLFWGRLGFGRSSGAPVDGIRIDVVNKFGWPDRIRVLISGCTHICIIYVPGEGKSYSQASVMMPGDKWMQSPNSSS